MPEFTEEQLNAVSEELFEHSAQAEADIPISQVTVTRTDYESNKKMELGDIVVVDGKAMNVTAVSEVGKEEIQSEAAKSLAKAEHDPIVPKAMTRQVWKQMMRIHFTIRRGLAQPCGHKLSTILVPDDKGKQSVFITSDPRKNCESCWFTYFNTNGQMTQIADECFQNAGRDVLERSRGKKFVKYFLMFMSTMARFQREAAERAALKAKEKSDGVEIESTDTGADGSVGRGDSTTDSSIGGVAGEAQSIDGVYSDPSYCPEESVDEGSLEGFGDGIRSMRQRLGDKAQPDSTGE